MPGRQETLPVLLDCSFPHCCVPSQCCGRTSRLLVLYASGLCRALCWKKCSDVTWCYCFYVLTPSDFSKPWLERFVPWMHPNFVNSSSKYLVTTGGFLFVICRKGSEGTVRGLPCCSVCRVLSPCSAAAGTDRRGEVWGRGGAGWQSQRKWEEGALRCGNADRWGLLVAKEKKQLPRKLFKKRKKNCVVSDDVPTSPPQDTSMPVSTCLHHKIHNDVSWINYKLGIFYGNTSACI